MPDQPAGGDLSTLRHHNALAVIQVLRGGSPLTLTEVSRLTGLSRPSTEDVVRDLLGQGWVQELGPVAGSMGRPARRYRFCAEAGHVLGVDIGGHKVLAALTDLEGTVVSTARRSVSAEAGRVERLAVVDMVIEQCLRDAGVSREDVWSAGVATTGLIDAAGRVLLSVALPEWTGVDLAGHVGRHVSGPVLVDNDSKLAALAESWRGVARHSRDVVYLLAGLRTGVGLIIDGKLHRGFANAAGEIGALPQVGWIRAQEHLRRWPDLPEGADPDDAAGQVFSAAREGDRRAAGVVRRYVKDVALGAAALVLTLDPELVVLGGGFSRSADVLLEPFRKELDKLCIRTPEVLTSALGDESVALGGVKLALDRLEVHVFDPQGGLAAPSR
jgi:predicted NBD/HSP70 family sugar kinase